jgi:flagellar hook-length control protein FliK
MDIQPVSSKANPAANTAGTTGTDDATNAFMALLNSVGARFTADLGAMDSKIIRDDAARTAELRDARDSRETNKARDDKNEERSSKSKDVKSRDEDKDTSTDETETATDDAADDSEAAASATPAAEDQAAAQVMDAVAAMLPVVTTEVVAPVVVAQQTTVAADTAVVQQVAVETAAATGPVAEIAAVTKETAKAAGDTALPQTQEIVAPEAPAAVQKNAEGPVAAVKQNTAQVAVQTQNIVVAEDTTKTAQTVVENATVAKAKDDTQATAQTQRSALAQEQSQDLSAKVGQDVKAQVKVNVTGPAHAQVQTAGSVYDIYSGYNNTQSSTANGQVGTTEATNALAQGAKTPAELAQAQAATSSSPAVAPQPVNHATQQGATPSAIRADIVAPAAAQLGGQNNAAHGETAGFGANTQSNNTSGTTASTATTATERPHTTPQQIIDQIKVSITRAAKAGLDKVTIRLRPEDLGRIDVKLEMSEDHKVRVTVTADNKDTLALLQSDSRALERTLNDAGLRTDSNNLHFSLRGDSDAQHAGDGKGNGKNGQAADNGATDEGDDIAMTYDYAEAARVRGGIDTFA